MMFYHQKTYQIGDIYKTSAHTVNHVPYNSHEVIIKLIVQIYKSSNYETR